MFPPVCASQACLRFRQSLDRTVQFRRKKWQPAASSDRSRPTLKEHELRSSCPRSRRQKSGRELDCVQENLARHKNEVTTDCPKRARLRTLDGTSLASHQVNHLALDKAAAPADPTASKDNAEFLHG